VFTALDANGQPPGPPVCMIHPYYFIHFTQNIMIHSIFSFSVL